MRLPKSTLFSMWWVNFVSNKVQLCVDNIVLIKIRCSSNLLTCTQIKAEITEIVASQRAMILQLVKLKARHESLRSLVGEEEGYDAIDAFCRAQYGLGDGCDRESELAIALMELTFRPLSFPGLDAQSCD